MNEVLIVYDIEKEIVWRAQLPAEEIEKHLDTKARYYPLPNRVKVLLPIFGAVIGIMAGSMLGSILPLFIPSLGVNFFTNLLMGSILLGALGAVGGWLLMRTRKEAPLWVVRRQNGSVEPVFHSAAKLGRWKGHIKRDKDGTVTLPAGVAVQSAHFMWRLRRSPIFRKFFRGQMSKWAKLQIGALCVLVAVIVIFMGFFAIATTRPETLSVPDSRPPATAPK